MHRPLTGESVGGQDLPELREPVLLQTSWHRHKALRTFSGVSRNFEGTTAGKSHRFGEKYRFHSEKA